MLLIMIRIYTTYLLLLFSVPAVFVLNSGGIPLTQNTSLNQSDCHVERPEINSIATCCSTAPIGVLEDSFIMRSFAILADQVFLFFDYQQSTLLGVKSPLYRPPINLSFV